MLFDRSLVLDPTEVIEIEVSGHRHAQLTIDGQPVGALDDGDVVRVRARRRDGELRALRHVPLPPDPQGQVRPDRPVAGPCDDIARHDLGRNPCGMRVVSDPDEACVAVQRLIQPLVILQRWNRSAPSPRRHGMLGGRMLTELHIENLGVIERLELILGDGLTVVTGETGAGKTMLVEAIELLVGGRADTDGGAPRDRRSARRRSVHHRRRRRAGAQPGDRPQRAVTRLPERPVGDGRVAGRSDDRARRPPRPARPPEPAVDRDATGRTRPVRPTSTSNRCARPARRLTEIDAELAALGGDERVRAREIDLLRYQLDELDRADVADADEDARLDAEETLLGDAVGFREAGEQAAAALADDGGARGSRWPAPSAHSAGGRRTTGSSSGCTPH